MYLHTVSDQILEAVTVWEWGYMHMLDVAAVQMMIAVEWCTFLCIFVTLTSQKKKVPGNIFSLAVLQA